MLLIFTILLTLASVLFLGAYFLFDGETYEIGLVIGVISIILYVIAVSMISWMVKY